MILLLLGGKIGRSRGVQGGGAQLIQGGAAQTALADLHGLAHQLLVSGDQGADAGAAGGEALGDGVDDDHVLGHIRELRQADDLLIAVDELPVHLVGDDKQIMVPGHVGDHPGGFRRQDGAGGVAGIGDEDGLGPGGDLRLDAVPVAIEEALLGGGGDGVDHAARQTGKGVVVGVEGLGDQHLVPLVQNALEDDLQGLAAAVGGQDVPGVQFDAQAPVIPPDRLHVGRDARGGRVGQHGVLEILDGREELLGRLNVRLSDVQVIDLPAAGLCLHGIEMEFTDGRQVAALDLSGKAHGNNLLDGL